MTLACHAYTHVDAPRHFLVDGRYITEMPVDQWVGEAAVVDLTHLGGNGEVTAADLERRGGHVRSGNIALLRTDWPMRTSVDERGLLEGGAVDRAERLRVARGTPGSKAVGYDYPPDYCVRDIDLRAKERRSAREENTTHYDLLSGRDHGDRVPDQPRRRSACRDAGSSPCPSSSKAPTALPFAPSQSSTRPGRREMLETMIDLRLAPMAAVTNAPFRLVCRECGAGPLTSEEIDARALVLGSARHGELPRFLPEERPLAIQLLGADPDVLAEAARRLEAAGADAIDLNMGCPVRRSSPRARAPRSCAIRRRRRIVRTMRKASAYGSPSRSAAAGTSAR